jgi:hypothetical protein
MNTSSKMTGAALAAAAAVLFGTASIGVASAAEEAKVQCAGINGCKGQGWVHTTEKECAAKGGKVVKM